MKEEDRLATNKIEDPMIRLGEAAIKAIKALKKFAKAHGEIK